MPQNADTYEKTSLLVIQYGAESPILNTFRFEEMVFEKYRSIRYRWPEPSRKTTNIL